MGTPNVSYGIYEPRTPSFGKIEEKPEVLNAYFAIKKEEGKDEKNKKISFIPITKSNIGDEIYIVVETKKLYGKTIKLNIRQGKEKLLTEIDKPLSFLERKEEKVLFTACVGELSDSKNYSNASDFTNFAITKAITLQNKKDETTKNWNKLIKSKSDKKTFLYILAEADTTEKVIYHGKNTDGTDDGEKRFRNIDGKWMELGGISPIILLDPGHGVKPGNVGTQARKYKIKDDNTIYDVLSLKQEVLDNPKDYIIGDNNTPSGGYDNENTESHIVYDIALKMKDKLNFLGYSKVYITRKQRKTVELKDEENFKKYLGGESSKSAAINYRSAMATKLKCDYFISIHCDGASDFSKGAHTIYSDDSSKQLAIDLLNNYDITEILAKSPHKRNDLGVLGAKNESKKKVLIELGYLSNPSDAKTIINNKNKIADLLVKGIKKNIENEKN